MAIIDCPDCGKRVSNRAATCSHCGAEVSGAEGAGSKRRRRYSTLQAQQLAAVCLFIVGALWIISVHLNAGRSYPRLALIMTGLGGFWYIITRVRMWWEDWHE